MITCATNVTHAVLEQFTNYSYSCFDISKSFHKLCIKHKNARGIDILHGNHGFIHVKCDLENPQISPITGKLDQSQGLQTLGTCLYCNLLF